MDIGNNRRPATNNIRAVARLARAADNGTRAANRSLAAVPEVDVHTRRRGAEAHIRNPMEAPRPVRLTDLDIRNLKQHPAARPLGDHRSTNIRRSATNSRIVRNDVCTA